VPLHEAEEPFSGSVMPSCTSTIGLPRMFFWTTTSEHGHHEVVGAVSPLVVDGEMFGAQVVIAARRELRRR
jgi:hypothetical protein